MFFVQKVLDNPLTLVYIEYVEWLRRQLMTDVKVTLSRILLEIEKLPLTEERITELLLVNESLAEDVRALTYKVADLTETVEILTRVVTTEKE